MSKVKQKTGSAFFGGEWNALVYLMFSKQSCFLKGNFFRAMGGDCPGRQFLIVVLKYSQQPVKKPKRLYALKKMDCYVV